MIVFGVSATRNNSAHARSGTHRRPGSRWRRPGLRNRGCWSRAPAARLLDPRETAPIEAARDRKQPPERPPRQPGEASAKIDGRGRRGLGYSHGDAPDAGFHTRYLTASCGAERSHLPPARPCRRDRILAWNGGCHESPLSAVRLDHQIVLNQWLTFAMPGQNGLRAACAQHDCAIRGRARGCGLQNAKRAGKALFQSLLSGKWIKDKRNLMITGPCGVGKTWLACALAQAACRDGVTVLYKRTTRLFDELELAIGRFPRVFNDQNPATDLG